jgi:TrmH family RNA methyltransferase
MTHDSSHYSLNEGVHSNEWAALQTPAPEIIQSKDNPLVKKIKGLIAEARSYQSAAQLWLEGEHLCMAAFDKGVEVEQLICAAAEFGSLLKRYPAWFKQAKKISLIEDSLLKSVSSLPSAAVVGFLIKQPHLQTLDPLQSSVILDRLQDAGNVGSVLRSAAAFGFKQIIAMKGTARLWSNKVIRSAMGAHFGMHLIENATLEDVRLLQVPILCTSSHQGQYLHDLQLKQTLPRPCAWVLGHEGQGVQEALFQMAAMKIKIAQPGGEESLNVAAASAVCLYASSAALAHQNTD